MLLRLKLQRDPLHCCCHWNAFWLQALLRFLVEKLGHLSPDFGTLKSPSRNIFVLLSSSFLKYEFSQHTPAKEQVKTLIFLHM